MNQHEGNSTPVPREIGGYRILRVLGSGGMATVYAAQQDSPRRVVALKVMKAALVSQADGAHGSESRAARRFRREVQILGKLRHQWIAQVFEAGTHDDGSGAVPFFVMEYIPGARTLLEFAAWKDLGLRDRLKLFVKVCSAVQHGHSSRIIHRDLKPANILVDEHGEPKIIDFGVAQAADVDLSMQTMHMDVGRLIGTIQYMSPEQVDGRPRNLTPASDVYALGVLLYRLVCMKLPYELEGLPIHHAASVISVEPPRAPSSIRAEVRGDLETIILKAMEKQPQRRYPNAGSLGRDIVRFLASKPIHARRAGMFYRGMLFLQRHRAAAVFSLAALALIAASIVITAMLASRQSRPAGESRPRVQVDSPVKASPDEMAMFDEPAIVADHPPPAREASHDRLAGHVNAITGLSIDAARSRLVSSGLDHRILVWDLDSRALMHRIEDHDGAVTALALSNAGSPLISADDDGLVIVRDAHTFGEISSRRVAHDGVRSLAVSPDARRIAACVEDLTIRVWDISGGELDTLRGSSGMFNAAAFSADGRHLAAGSDGGAVYVFDVDAGVLLMQFSTLKSAVLALAWSQDSSQIIAMSDDGRVCAWNLADGSLVREFAVESGSDAGGPDRRHSNRFLHNGAIDPFHLIIAGCVSNIEVRVWNLQDGLLRWSIATDDRASCIIIDSESSSIVVGEESGDIIVAHEPIAHD